MVPVPGFTSCNKAGMARSSVELGTFQKGQVLWSDGALNEVTAHLE